MSAQWPKDFQPGVVGVANGSSGISSICITLEAWRRGLEVTFLSHNLQKYSLSDGLRRVDFDYSRPQSITRKEDYEKLDNKGDTLSLLREHGIPTPRGVRLYPSDTSEDAIQREAEKIGYPVVLKPDRGSFGRGVMTNLKNWQEVHSAYKHLMAQHKPERILLEKHHEGDDYRVLVVGNQVVSAVYRIPANVVGDGRKTVSDLIAEKNVERKNNPFLAGGLITVDREVRMCLAEQNINPESVPWHGQHVQLRRVANASAGGDVVDVTTKISEQMKATAARAVRILPRVVIAGVDMLYNPVTGDYVVIEINSRPHIGLNMYPTSGTGSDVPLAIIDTLFPGTARPNSDHAQTLRFSSGAVGAALRSGTTTQVTLPPLPSHMYPYRLQVQYTANDKTHGTRVPLSALQVAAREHGVVGSLKRTSNGAMHLVVAAKNSASARKIINKISEWLGTQPENESQWHGAVSTTFTVIQE